MLARRTVLAAGLGVAARAGARDEDSVEYQVKAAFVCKFGNYIEWPPQALGPVGEPFRIGVLGSDAVLEEFRRTAASTSVAGRAVEIRRLQRPDMPDRLHAVFITRAMSLHTGAVIASVRGRPVLTVTESDTDADAGMVNFVVVDDKVRFDILLPAAVQSGLKISVRLLGVARRVEGR